MMKLNPIVVGGQAVVNGVMMRSPNYVSVSVRNPKKGIKSKTWKQKAMTAKNKFLSLPFLRGIVVLFDSTIIGIKALTLSTNMSAGEKEEELTKKELIFTIAFSLLFALFLFKLLPLLMAQLVNSISELGRFSFNLIEGVVKLLVFVLYLVLISQIPDIKVLFQYHGAEHKAVNCYEAKKKLTPKNCQKFTRLQPRCGTTFIFLVLFISIIVYLLIPLEMNFGWKLFWRLLLLPVIAGISYESIRLNGMYYNKYKLCRIFMAPGMAFQYITTKEPTLKQLEVSIMSLENVLKKEKVKLY